MAYSLPGPRRQVAVWPFALIARILRRMAQSAKARRERVALSALLELDDYGLWDLGIARDDLNRALRADDFDIDAIRHDPWRMDALPPQ